MILYKLGNREEDLCMEAVNRFKTRTIAATATVLNVIASLFVSTACFSYVYQGETPEELLKS